MKKFLKAIGYKHSKSDRLLLKGFFIVASLVAVIVGLFIFSAFWNGLWSSQVRSDRAKLDFILSNQTIDVVEMMGFEYSGSSTNRMTGEAALKFVTSLQSTNRIANIDWTKQQVRGVRLLHGSNEVCHLSIGEDGAWQFGAYGFRLRQ